MKSLLLGLDSEEEKKKKADRSQFLIADCPRTRLFNQELQTDNVCGFQFRD
jgi:hypothetical protein